MYSVLILATQLALFLAIGITPYVTRTNVCFGVSVPSDAQKLPEIASCKRRFILGCAVAAVLTALPALLAAAFAAHDIAALNIYLACTFVYLALIFLLYLYFYRTVKRLKQQHGWTIERTQVSVVSAAAGRAVPSIAWVILPALLLSIISVVLGYAGYGSLPDRVATHYNLAMQPDAYMDKTPGLIFMVPAIQWILGATMSIAYVSITKSRRRLEAEDPEGSARREQIFRSAWAWYTLVLGGLISGGFVFLQAGMFQFIGIQAAVALLLGMAGLSIVGAIALSLIVGQGGSRLAGKTKNRAPEIDYDDDHLWKLGSFYYNPDDPAVFVEKRFGVGYTSNFARPLTWLLVGGLVALVIGCFVAAFFFK